jgi:hypothetical protein
MPGELTPARTIGDRVYRKWRYPGREDHWYETYFVRKVTPKQVWVQGFMEHQHIVLKRRQLEKYGWAVSHAHTAVFVLEMPEEYRRTTIGYLMNKEPLQVLGLREGFTPEDLRAAYNRRVMETHPDRGGSPEEFQAVQAAFERLREGASIGDILNWLDRDEGAKP